MTIDCLEFCRALADETRQRILEMLPEREMCIGDSVDVWDMSQPTISHHLSILKQFTPKRASKCSTPSIATM